MPSKIVLTLFSQLMIFSLFAQEEVDSSYIRTLPDQFHVRSFLARKYTNLTFSENGRNSLNYEPNSDITLGFGITIQSFTLNLAYGFGFLNTEEEKGETTFLDLQSHIYKSKYIVDIFAQRYTGLFLNNTSSFDTGLIEEFYLRPETRVSLFGAAFLKVFNDQKFSYAAPFVQTEIQEKSAGTFLAGARMFISSISTDSSLIPFFANDSLYGDLGNLQEASAIQFGPSGGYAYSLIIKKRVFIMAALNLALMVGPVKYTKTDLVEEKEWQVNPVLGARLGIGYNSPEWYLGITFLQEGTTIKGVDEIGEANINGGNLQLTYVKRFQLTNTMKTFLEKLPF